MKGLGNFCEYTQFLSDGRFLRLKYNTSQLRDSKRSYNDPQVPYFYMGKYSQTSDEMKFRLYASGRIRESSLNNTQKNGFYQIAKRNEMSFVVVSFSMTST